MRALLALSIGVGWTLVAGCGARSGLAGELPPGTDAARPGIDAAIDAGRVDPTLDAGRDAGVCTAEDRDGDGVTSCDGDCDDGDPTISPRATEICNDHDDDCDGRSDEGVRSACDDCRPGCHRDPVPATGEPWDLSSADGLALDDTGALVLSSTHTESHDAWIANYRFGTVTRIDTRTGNQVGEYDSVILDGTNHAAPPGQECEVEVAGGNCPSRTAVDRQGNVYVANRAFFTQATVTKIAALHEDCVDRNGNGVIDTSIDRDGDGVIEHDVPGEYIGQLDECILWTVDVGPTNGIARAIAVDARGHVWVGLNGARQALELDPDTGAILRTIELGLFAPYGAAATSDGHVWFVSVGTGTLVAIDTATGMISDGATVGSPDHCQSSYGVAVGPDDVVWVAGFLCPWIYAYSPRTRATRAINLPTSGITRGIAVDAEGLVYVASSHDYITFSADGRILDASPPVARVTIVDPRTRTPTIEVVGTADAPLAGAGSTGVGLADGYLWLVNQDSSTATRIELASRTVTEVPTGIAPYTYSDFTGYALRTFVSPNGTLRTIMAGCASGPTQWERVDWSADVPPGTDLSLRVRTANTEAELATARWVGPFRARPTDLELPPGPVSGERFAELELTLDSGGSTASPRVEQLVVQYNCPF
ncbi:MAG: MopE-related protein [Sandaracinus sp.]